MLILLPPSEGKTAPASGSALDLTQLTFPELAAQRRTVLQSLVTMCRREPAQALRVLNLGPTQSSEVGVNAGVKRAPTAAAITIYTGVLYDALDAATLDAKARRRLQSSVVIASALFGLVRPNDRIPAYRLSADTSLPPLGPLTSVWRDVVSNVLAAQSGVVFDLRSGSYVTLGPLPRALQSRSVTGRVLLERNGKRSVVSHHNKATKGRIVRELMAAGAAPRSIDALMSDLRDLGYRLELHESRSGDAVLDIIVREI